MRALLSLLAAIWLTALAHADANDDAVRRVLLDMFNKPDAPLALDAVVVEADYALVDWSQGATGGRAFLRRKKGEWQLILCAGDEIRTAEALVQIGIPASHAHSLSQRLADVERSLPADRLALFSTFKGIARMDQSASPHPNH